MDAGHIAKGQKFNAGGQGSVWAVKDRVINGSWPVAYKEYHTRIRRDLQAEVLAGMVDFIPSLPHGTGQWLAECTAWPAVLVTDSAGVSGFLMRQIPDRFFRRFDFAPGEWKPAGFQFLLNDAAYFKTAGITITPRQRFELLLDFARTLGRLHSLDVVVGDMSPNNLLFSLEGTPSCFLIDCDAMGLHGKWALQTVETPGWGLPPGELVGSPTGDAYKFGLLAARLFAGEQEGEDLSVLLAADPAVGRLAERSLSANPARRPKPEQWLTALTAAVTTAPATLPQAVSQRTSVPHGAAAPASPRQATGRPQPQTVPNTPPTVPRPPYVSRTTLPKPAKSNAGRWFATIVLTILAFAYGPDLYKEVMDGLRSAGSGRTGQDFGSATPRSEEGQARALNGLLERNQGNRGSVGEAVRRMTTCPGGSGLREAKGVFEDAARERDELLRDLEALDPDLLPASLTRSLESSWQASADADRAYARLAEEMTSGCTPDSVVASSQWREAVGANTRATRAKKDFVSGWNPLAEEHGLTTMSWDDV